MSGETGDILNESLLGEHCPILCLKSALHFFPWPFDRPRSQIYYYVGSFALALKMMKSLLASCLMIMMAL